MLRVGARCLASTSLMSLILGCGAPQTAPRDASALTGDDAPARKAAVPAGCWTQVNADGFGDSANRWAWSMKAFGDHLYVGTLDRGTGAPGDDPDVGAPRASNESATTGAQVWRYDGDAWQRVVGDGFGNRFNLGIRNFVVYGGALLAATHNPATGAELWRTSDGVTWKRLGEPGLGNPANLSVRGFVVWRKKLWIGTSNARGAELWTYDGASWSRMAAKGLDDVGNHTFGEIAPLGDQLFIAAWNGRGARIYRFDGSTLAPVVGGAAATRAGFGDSGNIEILSMTAFRGALYASTGNPRNGFAVWRSRDLGASWQSVVQNGHDDPARGYGWRLHEHGDQLYLGTYVAADSDATAAKQGAVLYRTKDGITWVEEVGPRGKLAPAGFGDARNLGIRGLETFFDDLYVGTAQCYGCATSPTGAEIWHRAPEPCDE